TYLLLDRDRADFPLVSQADTDKVHVYTDPDGARVVHNLFATHHRIEQALRVGSLNLIAERLEELLEIGKPGALGVMISRAMTMFSAIRTTTNRRAPNEFQELSYEDWRKRLPVALSHIRSNPTQATLLTGGQSPRMSA